MELRRGKTFIKSSLQISHEKPQVLPATAQAREDAGLWLVPLEKQPKPHDEKVLLTSPGLQEYDRLPNKGAQSGLREGPTDLCGATFKLVQKSKTYNCVLGAGTVAATPGPLVGSASFPGPPSRLTSMGSCGGRRMIDYRHFVPQMPFVPAVAKSIPRKRISLKHPKKCFRNLFHLRRNKTENLASLAAKGKVLSLPRGQSEDGGRLGTDIFHLGEGSQPDSLFQDLSDSELPSDSSFDLCRALCEDVASLKSFDSLTGCGEIFADESSVPCLELNEGSESPAQDPQSLESNVPRGPSQGSMEQLQSPAQNDVSDFANFWDSVNRSVKQQQCALLGPWLRAPQGLNIDESSLDATGLAKLPLCPCRNPHSGSKASSIDTSTPKSEQPESLSTSDEGYYDAFSPSLEEDKKEALSPDIPVTAFPRDSYSGDALYELFYDSSEGPVSPSLNDDLCMSDSLSGPALGTSLSICSFHVGAEENLAPLPGPDLLGQGFLQSSWKGKECLLKLCDTELSITMGIINWLRRGPELRAPPAQAPGDSSASSGSGRASRGLVEKVEASSTEKDPCMESLNGKRNQPSGVGRAPVCSVPTGQRLWKHTGTKGLPSRESQVPSVAKWGTCSPSKDLSVEHLQVSEEEGISSVGSADMVSANTSEKSKTSNSSAWTSSQKEPKLPVNLGCLQGPWRLGLGGSTQEQEPSLMGCVAQVAALQVHQDSQHQTESHQRQNAGSGLCGRSAGRSLGTPQQRELGHLPSAAAMCSLSSQGSPFHNPQDQRCLDPELGLKHPRRAQRGQLDFVLSPQNFSPGTTDLASHSQQAGATSTSPTDHCSHHLTHKCIQYGQAEVGMPRLGLAEPHL
ncbi:APC membrane recruitment protein 3 [Orycteropus afer afer]|uniref:APC membrane recruitment protein 3 n=1 Tax=Orycteropus afer afer TaxID=1230840 RepID=A0A8B7AMH1_ORYAF|nr:APC membrane recruitment protein 3 [Orycteropus afer afer]